MPDCEMRWGFAQGESWCDPWDGSSQVVVGVGRRRSRLQVCGKKGEAKEAFSFCRFRIGLARPKTDSNLKVPAQLRNSPPVVPSCDRALQPRSASAWSAGNFYYGSLVPSTATAAGQYSWSKTTYSQCHTCIPFRSRREHDSFANGIAHFLNCFRKCWDVQARKGLELYFRPCMIVN